MKNKALIIILSIVCIAGFSAVVMLDNHQFTIGVRKAIAQMLEDGGIDIKPFWTTVDEDMIADGSRKEAESAGDEDIKTDAINDVTAQNKVNADLSVSEESADETEPQQTIIIDNTITVGGGVSSEESIADTPGNTEEETGETSEEDPSEVTYDEYMSMTQEEQREFMSKWDDPDRYLAWYERMLQEHKSDSSIVRKSLDSGSGIDVDSIESAANMY